MSGSSGKGGDPIGSMRGTDYPNPDASHRIEVPARLASKLSAEQCMRLEEHARQHHDSRKLLARVEHHIEAGLDMDSAFEKAKGELPQAESSGSARGAAGGNK